MCSTFQLARGHIPTRVASTGRLGITVQTTHNDPVYRQCLPALQPAHTSDGKERNPIERDPRHCSTLARQRCTVARLRLEISGSELESIHARHWPGSAAQSPDFVVRSPTVDSEASSRRPGSAAQSVDSDSGSVLARGSPTVEVSTLPDVGQVALNSTPEDCQQ